MKGNKIGDEGPSFGLRIAQQVAELHGGELQILTSPEGGNLVRVRLPV
jgi:signal transduction histidine kinase